MATVQPQTPAGPAPSPPQEGRHGDAPAASGEPPAAAGPGGEIAALDEQLAVGGGEDRKPGGGASAGAGGGGKLVAEAMRKYAAPRSSRFHGVTRLKWSGKYEAHLWDNTSQVEGRKRKGKHGSYVTEEQAAKAHDFAALKYWGTGPNTKLNFSISDYEKEIEIMKTMSQDEFVAYIRKTTRCHYHPRSTGSPPIPRIRHSPAAHRIAPAPAHGMASPAEETCAASSALAHPPGLLDYAAIHACLLRGDARLSLPLLALLLLLHFRFLAASAHFTPAVSRLAARLRLSPSMAAVTLLAIGNGAPDAFASAAALGGPGGMPRAGLAAVLSAGAFVSAFVVGAVALIAAPFAVPLASFARDVFFYLLAASGLFYIYLSAEIFLWQAVGLVLFYVFFVGLVFYMDLGGDDGKAVTKSAAGLQMVNGIDRVAMDLPVTVDDHKQHDPALCTMLRKVTEV